MRDAFCLSDGFTGLATDFVVFALLALSAWLVLRSGRISLGQQAFFAIGAYVSALGTVLGGWSLLPSLAAGALLAAAVAAVFAAVVVRLSGLQFAVATLAFAELVRLGLSSWRWRVPNDKGQLRGPDGMDVVWNSR